MKKYWGNAEKKVVMKNGTNIRKSIGIKGKGTA